MSRPVRIAFPDALYHVTVRGDRREAIFEDDTDRRMFLATLEQVVGRFNWVCHAWCLMDNHYHLLIQTPDGNLSKGMRQLNGVDLPQEEGVKEGVTKEGVRSRKVALALLLFLPCPAPFA